jgi:hypothetical protein
MLEGILPYPVEDYIDFSMPYLQGYVAKKRDLAREALSGEVKSRMNSYARTLLERTTSYDSLSVTDLDVSILSSHWEYSLMPIWIPMPVWLLLPVLRLNCLFCVQCLSSGFWCCLCSFLLSWCLPMSSSPVLMCVR